MRQVLASSLALWFAACGSDPQSVEDTAVTPDTVVDDTSIATDSGGSDTGSTPDTTPDTAPDTTAPCPFLSDELALATWPVSGPVDGLHPPDLEATTDTVMDHVSGLMWERAPSTRKTLAEAQAQCLGLGAGGFSDWRLPSRIEFVSIISMDPHDGWDLAAFPGATPEGDYSYYWTQSPNPRPSDCHTRLYRGSSFNLAPIGEADDPLYARCVRRPTPVSPGTWRLVISDETIGYDGATDLRWERVAGGPSDRPTAVARCAALSLGGSDDWRLPTHKELETIVDERRYPVLGEGFEGPSDGRGYWSSTVRLEPNGYPIYLTVDMDDGSVFGSGPASGHWQPSRCVSSMTCVPHCQGRVCGSDRCDGTCPGAACEAGDRCALDGATCEPVATCVAVSDAAPPDDATPTLRGPLVAVDTNTFEVDLTRFGLGAEAPHDALRITLTTPAVGTFDLAAGVDASPATCTHCVRLRVDGGARELFPSAGTLEVTAVNGGTLTATLTDLRFSEIDDAGSPVADGACVTIARATLSTERDATCADLLTAIGGDAPAFTEVVAGSNYYFGGTADLGLGGALPDAILLSFFSPTEGVYDLGSGDFGNTQFLKCSQCVLVFEDISATSAVSLPTAARTYFQQAGTMTISGTGPIDFTLEGLSLVQVTIDALSAESAPVPGGPCLASERILLQTGE